MTNQTISLSLSHIPNSDDYKSRYGESCQKGHQTVQKGCQFCTQCGEPYTCRQNQQAQSKIIRNLGRYAHKSCGCHHNYIKYENTTLISLCLKMTEKKLR